MIYIKRFIFFIAVLTSIFFIFLKQPFWANDECNGFLLEGIANQWYKVYRLFKGAIDPSFRCINIPDACTSIVVDVVIPLAPKDIETAVYTIDSVRGLLMHPIGKIFIIAPDHPEVRKLCIEKDCTFINEEIAVPHFNEIKEAGGWILQQFIKLNADTIVEQDHFLIIDADTILLRPQAFFTGKDRYILNINWEYGCGYKNFTKNLLQLDKIYRLDFVCHHMLMEKQVLANLKSELEKMHKMPWWQAIITGMKTYKASTLSEYDLYATFALNHYPEKYKFTASTNTTLHRDKIIALKHFLGSFGGDHKTISLHSPKRVDTRPH